MNDIAEHGWNCTQWSWSASQQPVSATSEPASSRSLYFYMAHETVWNIHAPNGLDGNIINQCFVNFKSCFIFLYFTVIFRIATSSLVTTLLCLFLSFCYLYLIMQLIITSSKMNLDYIQQTADELSVCQVTYISVKQWQKQAIVSHNNWCSFSHHIEFYLQWIYITNLLIFCVWPTTISPYLHVALRV